MCAAAALFGKVALLHWARADGCPEFEDDYIYGKDVVSEDF
jgi:hypothetical protein